MPVMTTAEAEGLRVFRRGKVRDTFELDDNTLLMVATDRLSAFDVVLPTPIPDKGRVLTQMSRWWFHKTNEIVPNHLLPDDPDAVPAAERDDWLERSMRVRRADRIDIECVVRGYISGSGWKEYKKEGTLAGEPLPAGPEGVGQTRPPALHPRGQERHRPRREHQPRQPRRRRRHAISPSGWNAPRSSCTRSPPSTAGSATSSSPTPSSSSGSSTASSPSSTRSSRPNSSRFWDVAQYREGESVTSMDKQFVRDFLETLSWDKTPPGPELPPDVVEGTRKRYIEAARRICELELA